MAFTAIYGFAHSSFRLLQFLFKENRLFFFFMISSIWESILGSFIPLDSRGKFLSLRDIGT